MAFCSTIKYLVSCDNFLLLGVASVPASDVL